ncbi:protein STRICTOSIDINE SYNTHASE-LIKE 6-like [Cynara cardunculus var. scolymus]|uniref:Six-bladed beta-propeller, TolB-like protein n=1 Tax=Cynara cardunculus var. scolymus TaxID=59895 RepID=A0A103YGK0_CYNCS|nr:protein STRICTOSIDINE SYNTHASE-LIKE 6-like [Cynara cardunculus var. scolymus]KVI08726.1 Six-bladed beta-propeller, TolB-like protein [Cynara cardunculus var. scolymus]
MAESPHSSSSNSPPNLSAGATPTTMSWRLGLFLSAVGTVVISLLLVQFDTFDAAPYSSDELAKQPIPGAPRTNPRILHGSEKIGEGKLLGPEDIVYDPKLGLIYTSCVDGWIKRVTVNDSVVEEWVNTGGRPLGLALGYAGEVYVADAYKGILKITEHGEIEVLTEEAEGVKFGTADALAVAENGMVYFTDATWKYNLHDFVYDLLEGRPYGRFMSYDPSTKQTKVIARDLYYANGVEMSPNQDSVIFCETPMMRCMRYYIEGEKAGTIDVFIDRLPGMPDNIRYDGEGRYWIGIPTDHSYDWDLARRYPFIRKVLAFLAKYLKRPSLERNSGALAVDLEGRPVERYYDRGLAFVTTGVKIGDYLYLGSLVKPFIIRLNITQYPATTT